MNNDNFIFSLFIVSLTVIVAIAFYSITSVRQACLENFNTAQDVNLCMEHVQ